MAKSPEILWSLLLWAFASFFKPAHRIVAGIDRAAVRDGTSRMQPSALAGLQRCFQSGYSGTIYTGVAGLPDVHRQRLRLFAASAACARSRNGMSNSSKSQRTSVADKSNGHTFESWLTKGP